MEKNYINPKDISGKDLAQFLGITPRRVSQLASAGTISNIGRRGRYDMSKALPAYVAYITGQGGTDVATRLIIARTRKIELQNDKAEGKLLSREDAASAMNVVLGAMIALGDSIPKKLATRLSRAKTPFEACRLIENEFSDGRQKIAEKLAKCCGFDPKAGREKWVARASPYSK